MSTPKQLPCTDNELKECPFRTIFSLFDDFMGSVMCHGIFNYHDKEDDTPNVLYKEDVESFGIEDHHGETRFYHPTTRELLAVKSYSGKDDQISFTKAGYELFRPMVHTYFDQFLTFLAERQACKAE